MLTVMRDIVQEWAARQLTDNEIEGLLALGGHGPLTPDEIAMLSQLRFAGRGNDRAALGEMLETPEEVERAQKILGRVLTDIEAKLDEEYYSGSDLIRLGRFLANISILPRAAALAGRMETARQYLGFTRSGYDEKLRTDAEDAEMLAQAEREEQRRLEIENSH